ncbi:ubiquitin-like protein 7 [Microplitis demolitor]|uniref:ubiquitin-like protein 7 n=1 Tax=Microplitis demolitor TaxID=69319 RepID=UPI0004CD5C4B|nr:ubiquitin-like protein 7 [Microplitis demolitor]
MATELLLGVRLMPGPSKVIKLNDVNLKAKVENLRMETATKIELPKDSFELIYCGCILEDDVTLESCGLKSGAMIHVLKKKDPEIPVPAKSISEESILQLASAFRSFNENPALRSALHRLSKRPEVIENIILTTPGLNEDSVAIAMLQDPDLMAYFTHSDTVKRIAELHPVLVEAAQLIAAAVHEEAHNAAASSGPSSSSMNAASTAYSYSLDNLSDDEMAGDSSQSSDSAQHQNGSSRLDAGSNPMAITTAQLAAALARAGANGRTRIPPPSSSSSSASTGSFSSGVITTEMFTQAMQQAFAASSASGLPPPLQTSASSTAISTAPSAAIPPVRSSSNLETQLAQMHEIGLRDDTINIQALEFTNGDVQAAIELVFSGLGDN